MVLLTPLADNGNALESLPEDPKASMCLEYLFPKLLLKYNEV